MKDPLTRLYMKDNVSWYIVIISICVFISTIFYKITYDGVEKIFLESQNEEVWMDAYLLGKVHMFLSLIVLSLVAIVLIHLFFMFFKERSTTRTLFIAHLPYKKNKVFQKIWWTNYIIYALGYILFSILVIVSTNSMINKYENLKCAGFSISNMRLNLFIGFLVFTFFYAIILLGYGVFTSAWGGALFTFISVGLTVICVEGINHFINTYVIKFPVLCMSTILNALQPFELYVNNLMDEYYRVKPVIPDTEEGIINAYTNVGFLFKYRTGNVSKIIQGELREETFLEAYDMTVLKSQYMQTLIIILISLLIGIIIAYFVGIKLYKKNEFSKNNTPEISMISIPKPITYVISGLVGGVVLSYAKFGNPVEVVISYGLVGMVIALLITLLVSHLLKKPTQVEN